MNHKIKRKWVAALRGDTYHQIQHAMEDRGTGRCALGVLAEVTPDPRLKLGAPVNHSQNIIVASSTVNLELDDEVQYEILTMNDGDHEHSSKSFAEIADWIETNL